MTSATSIDTNPAPALRKRGRPRKIDTTESASKEVSAVTSVLHKLGQSSKDDAGAAPEKPRKRGRPPKDRSSADKSDSTTTGSVAATTSPRKRGRPAKSSVVSTTATGETQPSGTRKRGRPSKRVVDKSAMQVDDALDRPTKRGRKSAVAQSEDVQAQPKRRGRPPKPRVDEDVVKTASPIKKRGRPPKNPRSEESDISGTALGSDVSIKIGRPPINAKMAVTPDAEKPKKRGRPPKTNGNVSVTGIEASSLVKPHGGNALNAIATKQATLGVEQEQQQQQPKKKGRPPKQQQKSQENVEPAKRRGRPPKASTVDAAPLTQPKRRGRPPKHSVYKDANAISTTSEPESESESSPLVNNGLAISLEHISKAISF
ncbi:hypothetical protein GGF40_004081 [Coemansia sp. RSA 1286]|nr:hypothetical protein GGF40_004081 [Coemansia sp. RSA 1286]